MTSQSKLFIAGACLLLLAGCGGGGEETPAPVVPAPVTPAQPAPAVSLSTTTVNVTAVNADDVPQVSVDVTLTNVPQAGLSVRGAYPANGSIETLTFADQGAGVARLTIQFKRARDLGAGVFDSYVTLSVCLEQGCTNHISGSPKTITTRYTVTGIAPLPGVAPIVSRAALSHDVIDAEFSAALHSLVMVSSAPRNSLYLYDVQTGLEKELALNKVPAAVSVSPDGLSAAVGHDALITHVALATIGQPGGATLRLLDVSADVFDIVLGAHGYVYALPRVDQWVDMHNIEIATNVEIQSHQTLRAGSHARLHPSGNFMYTADNGLSPSDIQNWDVAAGTATLLGDSPYHGDYPMCGNLWFSEDGGSIYTACGTVLRASAIHNQDMIYRGKLVLGDELRLIKSLSHSAAKKEILALSSASYCPPNGSSVFCDSRLTVLESDFLNPQATYRLGDIAVGSLSLPQEGLFVFHSADGTEKYLISRVVGATDPTHEYYFTVLQ